MVSLPAKDGFSTFCQLLNFLQGAQAGVESSDKGLGCSSTEGEDMAVHFEDGQ